MLAVDGVEVNAEGAFFGLEVDRVEQPLQTIDHGDPRKGNRLTANAFSVGTESPCRYISRRLNKVGAIECGCGRTI